MPFWGWLLALGTALSAFLVIALFDAPLPERFRTVRQKREAIFQWRLRHLREVYPYSSDHIDLRLIFIGTSLTNQAIAPGHYWDQRFLKEAGLNTRTDRLIYAGGGYHMLLQPELQQFLRDARPDLLFLEESVFLYRTLDIFRWPEPLPERLAQKFVFNINSWKALAFPKVYDLPGFPWIIDSTLTFETPHPLPEIAIDQKALDTLTVKKRVIRRAFHTRTFHSVLRQLTDQGTQVVILPLPRPDTVDALLLSPKQKRRRDQLANYYTQNYRTAYWPDTSSWPLPYFTDLSHMNQAGQTSFTDMLWHKIHAGFVQKKVQ